MNTSRHYHKFGLAVALVFTILAICGTARAEHPEPVLDGFYADPHIACFYGTYYIYPTTDGISGWRGGNPSTELSMPISKMRHGTVFRAPFE